MVKRLKSSHGEGTGGTSQTTDDPDSPSFDVATHKTKTDEKIRFLMEPHTIDLLTQWERSFLASVYGVAPLSRKQHIKVAGIYRKYTSGTSASHADRD